MQLIFSFILHVHPMFGAPVPGLVNPKSSRRISSNVMHTGWETNVSQNFSLRVEVSDSAWF